MKVLIFSGTARQGNFTQHVVQFVHQQAAAHDELESVLVSPDSLGLTLADEGQAANKRYPELTKNVIEADAYIIVSPEYNHGYPGSLKYMLDLHLKEYIHKPVALVGVSAGPFGGARVIEALTTTVRELGMAVTFNDLNVSDVQNQIKDGAFTDPEAWKRRTQRLLAELVWMAKTLKWGRENLESDHH